MKKSAKNDEKSDFSTTLLDSVEPKTFLNVFLSSGVLPFFDVSSLFGWLGAVSLISLGLDHLPTPAQNEDSAKFKLNKM